MNTSYIIDRKVPFKGIIESSISVWPFVDYSQGADGKKLTFPQYKKQRSNEGNDLIVVSSSKIDQLASDYEQSLITEPEQITEDQFYEMQNCLPPSKWHRIPHFEVFHISERYYCELVSWYIQTRGNVFYTFMDRSDCSDLYLGQKMDKHIKENLEKC